MIMCLTGSVLMSLGDQLSGHVFSRRTRSTSSLCTLMGCLGLSYTETPSQGNPRDSLGSQLTEGQSWKGLYWPGPQQLLQPPSALVSGGVLYQARAAGSSLCRILHQIPDGHKGNDPTAGKRLMQVQGWCSTSQKEQVSCHG